MRRQVRRRAAAPSSECQTAGGRPKRRAKRSSSCAVSAISGSRISAWRPARERRRHRLEVDLGLAGARHALEQGDAVARAEPPRRALRAARGLRRRQLGRPRGRAPAAAPSGSGSGVGRRAGRPWPSPARRPAPTPAARASSAGAARRAVRQRRQHPPPRRAQPERLAGARPPRPGRASAPAARARPARSARASGRCRAAPA